MGNSNQNWRTRPFYMFEYRNLGERGNSVSGKPTSLLCYLVNSLPLDYKSPFNAIMRHVLEYSSRDTSLIKIGKGSRFVL